MTDVFSFEKRRQIMSRIRSKDTSPEIRVRSLLHKMGYRFRLHRKDLPGNPDILLPRYRKAIFVHGCFWHQHEGCPRAKKPSTNREFWDNKLSKNADRDKKKIDELCLLGWDTIVVWQCEIKDTEKLKQDLDTLIKSPAKCGKQHLRKNLSRSKR